MAAWVLLCVAQDSLRRFFDALKQLIIATSIDQDATFR